MLFIVSGPLLREKWLMNLKVNHVTAINFMRLCDAAKLFPSVPFLASRLTRINIIELLLLYYYVKIIRRKLNYLNR